MAEQFDLAELERLHAAATPGQWKVNDRSIIRMSKSDPQWEIDQESGSEPFWLALALSLDNANLIVALHNSLPAILAMGAERERLRGEREKMAKALIKTWGVLEPICPWGSKDKIMSEHAEALAIARRIAK